MNKEQSNIIIYNTPDGKVNVALYAQDGDIWLNQNPLARMHISNILKENDWLENSVDKNLLTTATNGKNNEMAYKASRAAISDAVAL